MHITELLKNATGPQFSLEILPKIGDSAEETLNRYQKILAQKPLFVDIPYHAGRSQTGFSVQKHSVSGSRPKTALLAELLLNEFDLQPQPHILCHGFTPAETDSVLLQLHLTGVRNLILLRGDIRDSGTVKPEQHHFAYQLVEQVKMRNNGMGWSQKSDGLRTDFCIGVAGYPEPEEDFELSMNYLKKKTDAGADFIITQLFFENAMFFRFESACREAGITVPIIPGICPLTSLEMLERMPHFFQMKVPEVLRKQLQQATTKEEKEEAGIAWAVAQARELYAAGFSCVHFFALVRPEVIERVLLQLEA